MDVHVFCVPTEDNIMKKYEFRFYRRYINLHITITYHLLDQ